MRIAQEIVQIMVILDFVLIIKHHRNAVNARLSLVAQIAEIYVELLLSKFFELRLE